MKTNIQKIRLEKLSQKEMELFHNLKSENYGKKLAVKIAEKLMQPNQSGLYFTHRDYCGLGIFFHNKSFVLSTVYDGYEDKIIANFNSPSEFINWLSNENDQSMSLYGERFNNQTINRLRLDWFLEENYSPVWNNYNSYLRSIV